MKGAFFKDHDQIRTTEMSSVTVAPAKADGRTVENVQATDDGMTTLKELRENYREFEKQVLDCLPPVLNQCLYDKYRDAWRLACYHLEDESQTMRIFQQLLKEVPSWTQREIKARAEEITGQLPWLRDTLRWMTIAQIFIMLRIRNDLKTNQAVSYAFDLPLDEEIVHRLFQAVAQHMTGYVALYRHTEDETQRIRNTEEAEERIRKVVQRFIRQLVPIQDIVREHMHSYRRLATEQYARPRERDEEEEEEEERVDPERGEDGESGGGEQENEGEGEGGRENETAGGENEGDGEDEDDDADAETDGDDKLTQNKMKLFSSEEPMSNEINPDEEPFDDRNEDYERGKPAESVKQVDDRQPKPQDVCVDPPAPQLRRRFRLDDLEY